MYVFVMYGIKLQRFVFNIYVNAGSTLDIYPWYNIYGLYIEREIEIAIVFMNWLIKLYCFYFYFFYSQVLP